MTTNKDFWDNTLEHCSKEDKDYIASVLCKQIIYERDLAIQQLKDLGYGLGEKPKENKRDLISRGEVENVLHNNLHALISTDQLYQLYRDINHLPIYPIHDSAENKGDLISRQAVLDIWHTSYSDIRVEDEEIKYKKIAFELPPVENKGKWISHYDEDTKEGWYECSCCHSERAFNTNFCPDCGADMRGE